MTLTLYLLRHAKAEIGKPAQADHDRALNARGRKAAKTMCRVLRDLEPELDLVGCSTARRTRQTLAGVHDGIGKTRIRFSRDLYLASADGLLDYLAALPDTAHTIMLIGHNPGLHDLAISLTGAAARGQARARMRMIEKFPTGALCEIKFQQTSWKKIAPGTGTLQNFVRPRDLD